MIGLAMMILKISLVNEFTDQPGGRLRITGPHSGQEFFEDHILPALEKSDSIEIDLNEALGIPPSFLDESIGNLIKRLGINEYKRRVRIVLDEDDDPDSLDIIKDLEKDTEA